MPGVTRLVSLLTPKFVVPPNRFFFDSPKSSPYPSFWFPVITALVGSRGSNTPVGLSIWFQALLSRRLGSNAALC